MQKYLGPLPAGTMIFSIDAVGMYANVDTNHGIQVIGEFILKYRNKIKNFNLPHNFIVGCLELIMKNKFFQFEDMFFKKINSIAMGISCAVNWVFLYMRLLEILELLVDFIN